MPPGYRHMTPVAYATWVPSYDTRVICHLGVAYDGPPYPVMTIAYLTFANRCFFNTPLFWGMYGMFPPECEARASRVLPVRAQCQ